ncbi:MAG: Ig-like domain repeat protein [Isosphaeraceae bacterium]
MAAIPAAMSGSGGRRRDHRRYRPGPLILEDRRLLSTFAVTSTADNGNDGTLRWAVAQADAADSASTIEFELGTAPATITLSQVLQLELSNTSDATTIEDGPGQGPVTVSGDDASQVFQIDSGVTATITGLTIADGSAGHNGGGVYNAGTLTLSYCTISGSSGFTGGGIYNKGTATLSECTVSGNSGFGSGGGLFNQGTMSLTDCTLTGNITSYQGGGGLTGTGGGFPGEGNTGSGNGGGIFNHGTLDLTDCTLSGNSSSGGGGLFNYGSATLLACTISDNVSPSGAGGIYDYSYKNDEGNATLTDCIVAGNSVPGNDMDYLGVDAVGGGITGSYNLVGDIFQTGVDGNITFVSDPLLAPLGNYGGPTQTMPVLPGSLAIGAGVALNGVPTDQRGVAFGSTPDIGAFESEGFTITPVAGSTPQSVETGDAFANPLAVTVAANNPIEPVAGGVVAFTASPPPPPQTSGPSALLSGSTAVIGSDGVAQVTATANNLTGAYTVSASASGTPGPAVFDLFNVIPIDYSDIIDQSITYGTASLTVSGTLSSASGYPQGAGESVAVSLDGVIQQAPFGTGGTFSTTFTNTVGLTVGQSPYTIEYVFSGDDSYAPAITTSTVTVTPATPTVSVSDSGGVYDDTAFPATASVAGLGGSPGPTLEGKKPTLAYYSGIYTTTAQLSGVTPLSATPSDAGTYTVLARFPGSTDYTSAEALANFTIAQATPTVTVADHGGTFDNDSFPATDTVAGIAGSPGSGLEGIGPALTYYSGTYSSIAQLNGLTPLSAAPSIAGAYTALATFPGSTDYTDADAIADFTIAQAAPTLAVADPGGTYTGSAFPATDTVAGIAGTPASRLEGVTPLLAYYSGTYTSIAQLAGIPPEPAPIIAGAYTILATFPGSTDYSEVTALAGFTIAPATPTVTVADPSGTYDGSPFAAAAEVAGVGGQAVQSLEGASPSLAYYRGTYSEPSQLDGLTPLTDAPSDVGSYTALATFPGSTDYTDASSLADFTIGQATPTVTVSDASGPYTGSGFSATGTVAGISGPAGANLQGVPPGLAYYSGAYTDSTQLIGLTPLTAPPIDAGAYTVLATFPGSTDYTDADALADFTITQVTPSQSIDAPGGTYDGSPFTASATVAGSDGTPGPTLQGIKPSLIYYSGGYTNASLLDGLTPLPGAPTQAGTYTVLATFPGSTDYTSDSTLASFTIVQAAPRVTWNPPSAIVYGTPLSATQLDATASIPGTFTYTPALGAIVDAGQTLSVTFTPGDSTDYTTTVATTTIPVDKATPTLDVSDPGGRFDGSVFPASVTIAGSGSQNAPAASLQDIAPTLTYYNHDGTSLGSAPPSDAGTYTVIAVFPGNADYAAVRSAAIPFTIAPGDATIALTSSVSAAVYGQPVTFVANVSPAIAGSPTGSVTFTDGGTPLATVALDGSGTATFATADLALGSHAIAASYSGDADFLGAQSGPASVPVSQARTAIVLVPHPILHKKHLKLIGLTAEIEPVSPGGGVPNGGTVTFEFGKKHGKKVKVKILGTAAIINGDATLSFKPNKVLNKPLTIVYSGDPDDLSGTLNPPKLTKRAIKSLE